MRFGQLKRREFITLLGSATAWPFTARGQNGRMARIAFLNPSSPQAWDPHNMEQFKQGLEEMAWSRDATLQSITFGQRAMQSGFANWQSRSRNATLT